MKNLKLKGNDVTDRLILFFLLIFTGCNLIIGLEKERLPEKAQQTCKSNEDCDDGHGCTMDMCDLETQSCAHYLMNAGTACREKTPEKICDIETEYCDGRSRDCPEDKFQPETFLCRIAQGECDEPEYCTGNSPNCPPDSFSGIDKVCNDNNECTYNDRCNGEGICTGTNGLIGVKYICSGPWGMSFCVLTESNEIKCWGNNVYGQVGDGTNQHRGIPVHAGGELDGVTALSCGGRHVCVLLDTGGIKCWGLGDTGQLGDGVTGTYRTSLHPVDVINQEGEPWLGWKQVSGGYLFNCAIDRNNEAYCWGKNDFGQLGIEDSENEICSVEVDVPCKAIPEKVSSATGLSNVSFIAAGTYHTCAIDMNGKVWCWGRNDKGQIGQPVETVVSASEPLPVDGFPPSSEVISLTLGIQHTCALLSNGKVMCWGGNQKGQLGLSRPPEFISTQPLEVTALPENAKAIDSSFSHNCAILENGKLMCWGANEDGQIGDGTAENKFEPAAVIGLDENISFFDASTYNTCAVLEDSTVWCWGNDMFGQLGNNCAYKSLPSGGSPVPVQVKCEAPEDECNKL